MKKIGQALQRLIFYVIAAVFILNFRRLFTGRSLSFFPLVMLIAVLFLVFAWGMMKAMFAGADDSPVRKGESPANAPPPVYDRPILRDLADEEIREEAARDAAPQKPNYKRIASEIGTEAELREIERREKEELKRLEKGR